MKTKERAILLIGTAQSSPDILHKTGFSAPDAIAVYACGSETAMVVSRLEYGRAVKTVGPGTEVYTPEDLRLCGADAGRISAWAHALLRKKRKKSVSVSPLFPVGVARALEKKGINIHVSPGPLFPGRKIKSDAELRKIAQSQKAAIAAMAAVVDVIDHARTRRGRGSTLFLGGTPLTSERVRTYIDGVLLQLQCTAPEGSVVAGGRQGADPHESGHGPLRKGQLIVIDIFPRSQIHGYWGDLSRTVIKGRALDSQRGLFEAVRAAQRAALSKVRPGTAAGTVHRTAAETLSSRGYVTERNDSGEFTGFIHSTGHGVGLEIHEQPGIGPNKDRLRKGNVITVEPGLYYPQIGGVRIEDTIAVTAKGWRYLAKCPMHFEIM